MILLFGFVFCLFDFFGFDINGQINKTTQNYFDKRFFGQTKQNILA